MDGGQARAAIDHENDRSDFVTPLRGWGERIGIGQSRFHVEDKTGTTVLDATENIADNASALARVFPT